jgi:hypothetical protein
MGKYDPSIEIQTICRACGKDHNAPPVSVKVASQGHEANGNPGVDIRVQPHSDRLAIHVSGGHGIPMAVCCDASSCVFAGILHNKEALP